MHVELSPDLAALVQEKMESGGYGDANEVVEEALRLLAEHDRRFRQLHAAVTEGFAQIERGQSVLLTEEHLETLMHRAIENTRRGKPIKDDVGP